MHAKVIRYLVEVVRAGSIRKAAEQLHVAPTAINRQLLILEDQFGTPLFERIRGRLRLTPVGEIVLAHARGTLHEFELVRRRVEAVRGLHQGEATLSTTAGLAGSFLPTVISRFRALHPGIQLRVVDLPIAAVLRSVADGDSDIALAYDAPHTAGLRSLFTSDWPIGAVVPRGHPLTANATTVLAECIGYPLILPAQALSIRGILDGAFGRSAISVSPILESTSTALMRRLVIAGDGITFLNRLDIIEDHRDGSLVFVPLRDAVLRPQTLTLVTRASTPLAPSAQRLADQIADSLDTLLTP
ncbi:LysR family transcriptional regulator [Variovorax sp. YR216]|uniref:LysR family transcriptional regulator n=1 Tax=Variovorax sp. YR216 TaxID=1882828 RepID=UPI000894E226|nr:LysR family transcriptional regulator [Variovorax sp. YR216]SEA95069.1 DNA-binding transcriptional regulator, LysR family [Variovorax sp. YR216]